nr:class I poly(R)-hydroxyalkanoic acid synthase [Croceicoccus sp. YJ47]
MAHGADNSGKDAPGNDWLTTMMAGPFAPVMAGPMREMVAMQSKAAQAMFDAFLPRPAAGAATSDPAESDTPPAAGGAHWQELSDNLTAMWQGYLAMKPGAANPLADPAKWMEMASRWMNQSPLTEMETQQHFLKESLALWQNVLGQYGMAEGSAPATLPRQDRRFADEKWREQPLFAMLHQAYLLCAEEMMAAVDKADGLPDDRREQMRFFTRLITESLSPAHFPLTNPLVIERTLETGGENLLKGMQRLINDLQAGQITHTDTNAFEIGRDIAATPGKVVHETELYQLIQYSPTTDDVLKTPLVVFPPWINRFYILDLGEKKSFVKWAVAQGLTLFMVSWKSADSSMADVTWSDYVRAQVEAIDFARERLKVPSVHTIGYCVAGTTLAATLAMLHRRGEADRVASATFFTAQVDFSEAGDLKAFIDEQQMAAIEATATDGYVDGRYLATTFNLLRSPDLIWSYVLNNYLLGEDYRPFDLLYWNGDTTNLPARWHREYLRDLYHHNRLVEPDAMAVDDTPVDLRKVTTPVYIQAGKEDHIAPLPSVWKLTRHFSGPMQFTLAGSGHIAGVVNPPAGGKYQYWTLPDGVALPETLDEFREKAVETPGSWWPDWIEWLRSIDDATVKAKGKRKPGGKGDTVIEDAPGRYVKTR